MIMLINGYKLFNRATAGDQVYNNFLGITGSSNINLTRNNTINLFSMDLNKLNISGLTNYYDKTVSDANYYTKTYINTNYYTTTQIDALLNAPSMPAISGFINSVGTINRDNGRFPFTISKTATGTYNVLFTYVAGTNNYSVSVCLRISTGGMATYSNQTTGGFYVYTFNPSGTLTDIGFSFMVFWSQIKKLFKYI